MSALSVLAPQVDPTAAAAATSAAALARRGQIHATAQKFEASFLTTVLQTMFQSVSSAPPFGGGPGEDMWKGFLAEAMAKDMARRGGIGVAPAVEREMLKLQELKDGGQAGAGAGAASASAAAASAAAPTSQGAAAPQVPPGKWTVAKAAAATRPTAKAAAQ